MESKVLSELAQSAKNENLSKAVIIKPKKNKIHGIPCSERYLLYRILDDTHEKDPEFWKKLAEYMGLSVEKIQVCTTPYYT